MWFKCSVTHDSCHHVNRCLLQVRKLSLCDLYQFINLFCRYEFVRNIQALLNQGIAQSLFFIALSVSLGNDYVYEVCLSLGSLVHYLIMVSFMWLLIRPIVLLFSLIQRNFYERDCFILPFIFIAWGKYSY